jgi:hypothetical protein
MSDLIAKMIVLRAWVSREFRLGPGKELDPEVEKMKREFDRNRI